MLALDGLRSGEGTNPPPTTREARRGSERSSEVKPSEYGGADTDKTYGIQPYPHVLTANEKLRLQYTTDPADEAGVPDPTQE